VSPELSAGKLKPVPSTVVCPDGLPSGPGQVNVTVVPVTSQADAGPGRGEDPHRVGHSLSAHDVPGRIWSRESVRRFALQLEGDRWGQRLSAADGEEQKTETKPLATDDHLALWTLGFPPLASYL